MLVECNTGASAFSPRPISSFCCLLLKRKPIWLQLKDGHLYLRYSILEIKDLLALLPPSSPDGTREAFQQALYA